MSDTTEATGPGGLLRPAALAVLLLMTASCSASRPCDSDMLVHTPASEPPHPCRVDGCSMAPDFDFGYCCDNHDARYWSGGSAEQRKHADREFRACIVDAGHPLTAGIYYYAVRMGGTPHLPTSWRWGFGWDYPHGYTEEDNQ